MTEVTVNATPRIADEARRLYAERKLHEALQLWESIIKQYPDYEHGEAL